MKVLVKKTNMVINAIPVARDKVVKFMDVCSKDLYDWEELGPVRAEPSVSSSSEKAIPITVNIGVIGDLTS